MTQQFNKQLQSTQAVFTALGQAIDKLQTTPGAAYATKLYVFTKLVETNGIYDLKNHGYDVKDIGNHSIYNGQVFRFDDYGNYNYGVAARAFGIGLEMALFGAGMNQIYNGEGDSSNLRGFGDDPRDTQMIINGYNANIK